MLTMLVAGAAHAAAGGPDGGGYFWADSDDPSGPGFMWEDLSSFGRFSSVSFCDECTETNVSIGFDFVFYGQRYTELTVSSNGLVTFENTAVPACCTGRPLPSVSDPNAVIAMWWNDLNPGLSGQVYVGTAGNPPNRRFIVSFVDVVHFSTSANPVSVQLKLYETSNIIELHYLHPRSTGSTHSTGIEDHDGLIGTTYYIGGASLLPSTAVRFFTCTNDDDDGDGVSSCAGDCDDLNPAIFPGRGESCDGLDQDCNSIVDDGFDLDGDGFTVCGPDGAFSTADDDCDDADPNVNPVQVEVCDGIDNDCVAGADFPGESNDDDADGWLSCEDCDDLEASTFPGSPEVCDASDQDCDGVVDNGFDLDADGFPTCGPDGVPGNADDDCDDGIAAVNPGLPEVCDGLDTDCSGSADFPGELTDVDNDGYWSCEDCNDFRAQAFPGAPEMCDARDEDCDGVIDNGYELDGDGVTSCGPDGNDGNRDDDCDDGDATVYPGAPEVCDGVDNDCTGAPDLPGELDDNDNDGALACEDCDDAEPAAFPGATELCDFIDNTCDGFIDEGFDTDSDGFSVCAGDCVDTNALVHPDATEIPYDGLDNDCVGGDLVDVDRDGYAAEVPGVDGDDCDDNDPMIHPDAVERCNDLDDDCNNRLGEDELDQDGDGYSFCDGDCNDSDTEFSPGVAETCDQRDNDCDGEVDEDFDRDGDGFVTCGGARDCNDNDFTVGPELPELCDNRDNDCDGWVDEDALCGTRQCGHGSSSAKDPGVAWLLLGGLLWVRRRALPISPCRG
jgi:hypothetical protein